MLEKPSIGLLGGGPRPGGSHNDTSNGEDPTPAPPHPPSMMTLLEMDRWRKEFEEHFQSQVEQIRRVEGKCDQLLLGQGQVPDGGGGRSHGAGTTALEETVLNLKQELKEEREGRREAVQKLEETIQQLEGKIEELTLNMTGWREQMEGMEKWREEREERRRSRVRKRPRAKLAESHHHDPHPRQLQPGVGPSSSTSGGGGGARHDSVGQVPPVPEGAEDGGKDSYPVLIKMEPLDCLDQDGDVDIEYRNYDMGRPLETGTFPAGPVSLNEWGFNFESSSNQAQTPPQTPVKRGRGRPRGARNRRVPEAKRFSSLDKLEPRKSHPSKKMPQNPSVIHGRAPKAGKFLPFLCACGLEFDAESWLLEHVGGEVKPVVAKSSQRTSNKGRATHSTQKEKKAVPLKIRRKSEPPGPGLVLNGDKKTKSNDQRTKTKFQSEGSEKPMLRRYMVPRQNRLFTPIRKSQAKGHPNSVGGIKRPRGRPRKVKVDAKAPTTDLSSSTILTDSGVRDPIGDTAISETEEPKATACKDDRRTSEPFTAPMKGPRKGSRSTLEPSIATQKAEVEMEGDNDSDAFFIGSRAMLAKTEKRKVGRPRKIKKTNSATVARARVPDANANDSKIDSKIPTLPQNTTLNEAIAWLYTPQEAIPAENEDQNVKDELIDVDLIRTRTTVAHSIRMSENGSSDEADGDWLPSAPRSEENREKMGKKKIIRPRGRPPKRRKMITGDSPSSAPVSNEEKSRSHSHNPFAKVVASFRANEVKSKKEDVLDSNAE